MIPRNPYDFVDSPKGYRGELEPLDDKQVRVLLATAKATQPRLYALYVFIRSLRVGCNRRLATVRIDRAQMVRLGP